MTKNHNFHMGYDKGYTIFIFDENSLVCIQIYFNKNHLKNINDQNFAYFMRGYDKGFYDILLNILWSKIKNY